MVDIENTDNVQFPSVALAALQAAVQQQKVIEEAIEESREREREARIEREREAKAERERHAREEVARSGDILGGNREVEREAVAEFDGNSGESSDGQTHTVDVEV